MNDVRTLLAKEASILKHLLDQGSINIPNMRTFLQKVEQMETPVEPPKTNEDEYFLLALKNFDKKLERARIKMYGKS